MSIVLARRGSAGEVADSIVASLRRARAEGVPFLHWMCADLLPRSTARALATLPCEPPELGGVSGRREIHNDQRRYFAGQTLVEQPLMHVIATAFQSISVVAALAALTGVVLAGSSLRIEYALDVDGFWLEPHTDLGVKLLTLFLQLAGPGQEDLGTDLYRDPATWVSRVPFSWNAAVIFAPSGSTWHGFEPRPIPGVRRSLIVNYVTDAWRDREQLAYPERPVG